MKKNGEVITTFTMDTSAHKVESENPQFYWRGEWYMVVYQLHTDCEVVIPCNVYARDTNLYNKNNDVFNADIILIDDKPLPPYKGRLKSLFAIC